MTEMLEIIAESEGIKTPTKKRTRADVEKALENFNAKRAAKKAGCSKAGKSAKQRMVSVPRAVATGPKDADAKPKATYAEPIPMNFISETGYVREAAFDPKSKMFYVAFAKSVWARPSTQEKWDAFEKAVADPLTNIDQHYRQNFKGTDDMIPVRKSEVGK